MCHGGVGMKTSCRAFVGREIPFLAARSWNQGFESLSRRKEIGIADAICAGAIPAEGRGTQDVRPIPLLG